jgi:superfamily II DNA or RNA helicase
MRTILLSHNKTAYQKVMKAFETSDRTCVVHPTGTGKSYLIAAVSESFKRVLILGPNDFVLDQVHEVLQWRKDIEYMTYQMLCRADDVPTGYDLICLDEFHRAGAPSWGVAVDELLEKNPQSKVFGTSATPIRYLDNDRDMSDEIFRHNVASHISIGEAWSRSILPIPSFVIGLFNFHKTLADAEERINNSKKLSEEEKRRRIFKLSNARLEWEQSMGMPTILRKHLDKDIKRVIIFCADIRRLESMRETVIGWFRVSGFKVESSCTVHIGQTDKQIREAMNEFESDDGDGVRLMFSVNMLNEGVHIPRVGAVLMLRTTASRIIYLQQMGRCLTAANTEKPVILDMVDNITTTSAVHGLMDDFEGWQHLMKSDVPDYEDRRFKVTDYKQTLRDVLQKISPLELSFESWEEKLEQLMDFCEKHGRTPSRSDGDIFRKYMYLMSNYRETEEVKFIVQKYARQIMWNENNREFMENELREFIDTRHRAPSRWLTEDLRWYKMFKVISKNAPEHPLVAECKQMEEQRKAEERERYYWECVDTLTAFCEQTGRMPKSKPLPDGSYEPYRKWCWLRENYPQREEVMSIREKYAKHAVGPRHVLPLEQRISLCEAICHQYNRQPHASYDDPVTVRSWTYLKRLHADNPRVKVLMQYPVLSVMHKRIEIGIKKVEDFFEKYGRLPRHRKNVSDEEKQALNSMVNIFEKYADEPRVQALMEKRGRGAQLERSIIRIVAFEKKHHRLPNSSLEEVNDRNVWLGLRNDHADEPEIVELIAKYNDTPEGRRNAAIQKRFDDNTRKVADFEQREHRLPSSSSLAPKDERSIYTAWKYLRQHHPDCQQVKELQQKYGQKTSCSDTQIRDYMMDFTQQHDRLPSGRSDDQEESRMYSLWRNRIRRLVRLYPELAAINERYSRGKHGKLLGNNK